MESAWRRLQDDGHVRSPFLTWEWASSLADVPTVSGQMYAVLLGPPAAPVGLLPVEWSGGPDGVRAVGIAGWQWLAPDHLDVVAPPEAAADVAGAVVRFLVDAGAWDVLDLDGAVPDGALHTAVAALRPPRFLPRAPEPVLSPYVTLLGRTPAEILPSRNLRQQVARGLRAAERSGGGLRVECAPDAVVAALEELMRLHNARFGSRSAVFATEPRRAFHRLAAYRLAATNRARVYRLTAEGQDAALLYALGDGDRLQYYSMGMRPEAALSPGRTLLGQSILAAAAEGVAEFDLLRGEHDFKLRFASGVREDVRLRVLRPTVRTVVAVGRRLPAHLMARLRPSPADADVPPERA